MNILFVFSYPRAVIYILPAIEELSKRHNIFYFNYRQMSSFEKWTNTEADLRNLIAARLDNVGAISLGEPKSEHSEIRDTYSNDFKNAIKNYKLDIAVFDESYGKKHWGSNILYQLLRRRNIPTIGCQEGSVDNDLSGLKLIAANLGFCYDYCFCFGGYDLRCLKEANNNLTGRIYAVGIPANDAMKKYTSFPFSMKKHILLVTSFTLGSGVSKIFEPMTEDVIIKSGIYEIAKEAGLPVLIKEKAKRWSSDCVFKYLQSDSLKVTMAEQDLDQIIGESLFVIGAPSTLLFKPIQAGIPTVVMKKPYMGRYGVFTQYEGFADLDGRQIKKMLLDQQKSSVKNNEFIEEAVRGGSDFTSTSHFVNAVESFGKDASIYQGPRTLSKKSVENVLWNYSPGFYKYSEFLIKTGYRKIKAYVDN